MSKWFDADKDGLRQIGERLIERRGFGIIGAELYQNALGPRPIEAVARNCARCRGCVAWWCAAAATTGRNCSAKIRAPSPRGA